MTVYVEPGPEGQFPVEDKVKAATASSYLVTLLLTGLAALLNNDNLPLLIGFLPNWLEPFVLALIPAAVTAVAGYLAPHQYRSEKPL